MYKLEQLLVNQSIYSEVYGGTCCQSVLKAVHKARAQWQAEAGAPGARALPPAHGLRALLPALVELHKRALTLVPLLSLLTDCK